ncbi:MAG: hypothetical protein WAU32_07230 [Thermoanaerobaculia bacterium]
MGKDLVSACVFCAGLFLGSELTPRQGFGVDIGFSYATLARRYDVVGADPTRVDGSDVTPKFVLIGLGQSRQPADGLGAGTAAFQWRVRVAFAPSHDEQERKLANNFEAIHATGNGRYENYEVLGRLPVTAADSAELIAGRRVHNATDIVNVGGSQHSFTESRGLTAGRIDIAAGWRHRWQGLEAAAAVRTVKPESYFATAGTFRKSDGWLWGGTAELRARRGAWTASLLGEHMAGSLTIHEESEPAFNEFNFDADASLTAVKLTLGHSWPRTDLFFSATYDRQRLPFVSLAVLGTEGLLFDGGYHPDSTTKEWFGEILLRHALTAGIRVRLALRLGLGDETVKLTDLVHGGPPLSLDVNRRGVFGGGISSSIGAPELAFFIGADFGVALGAP